jgi:hypothetical protein
MTLKLVEIRDAATFIPVAALRMDSNDVIPEELWLLGRSGFRHSSDCVYVIKLATGGAEYDPFRWPASSRTMQVAHKYIEEHFEKLNSGDVVDVEFILGLTTKPKTSERLEYP